MLSSGVQSGSAVLGYTSRPGCKKFCRIFFHLLLQLLYTVKNETESAKSRALPTSFETRFPRHVVCDVVRRQFCFHRKIVLSVYVRHSYHRTRLGSRFLWLSDLGVSALGIRARCPGFESRVTPLLHWVATLGKLFTHIASPVSQLQETGVQKGVFGA